MSESKEHAADFDLEPPDKEVERYCSERAQRQRAVGDEVAATRTEAGRDLILARLERLHRGRGA